MKRSLKVFGIVLVVAAVVGCSRRSYGENQVCFGGRCVAVEVVKSEEQLKLGLQFRPSLGRGEGMLFVFPETGRYPFWMKNTLIPLDMIWFDENSRIVDIKDNVPPCRRDPCAVYDPAGDARYVLEVNAGYAAELGIKAGEQAQFLLDE